MASGSSGKYANCFCLLDSGLLVIIITPPPPSAGTYSTGNLFIDSGLLIVFFTPSPHFTRKVSWRQNFIAIFAIFLLYNPYWLSLFLLIKKSPIIKFQARFEKAWFLKAKRTLNHALCAVCCEVAVLLWVRLSEFTLFSSYFQHLTMPSFIIICNELAFLLALVLAHCSMQNALRGLATWLDLTWASYWFSEVYMNIEAQARGDAPFPPLHPHLHPPPLIIIDKFLDLVDKLKLEATARANNSDIFNKYYNHSSPAMNLSTLKRHEW